MAAKPMLDGIALQQVQEIDGDQTEVFNQCEVPALEGDFHQDLGRRSTRIRLNGVLTGANAADSALKLRTRFQAGTPVSFVADIALATRVRQVLIEEMAVRELAGKPKRFEYALSLVEFLGGTKAKSQPAPAQPPPPPNITAGILRVAVMAGGHPNTGSNRATVMVAGAQQNDRQISKTLSQGSDHIWSEEQLPPGQYTVRALLTDPPMSGSAAVMVRAAQSAHVTVTLRTGATIARAFVAHFSPGKSFVEPAMFPTLWEAAEYAEAHPSERLLVAGHADAGADGRDSSAISEERARAVFACLTYARSGGRASSEWNALRQTRPADRRRAWGRREYQLILQELGYFQGQIEGDPQLTGLVVRDFQLDHGLAVDGLVGEATWSALIEAYLSQKPMAVPGDRFLPDAFRGFGVQRVVRNTRNAWRPNRRVELLFVKPEMRNVDPDDWEILAAEPASVVVAGSVRRDDGTPCAGLPYVLTAPDGEYMDGEQSGGQRAGAPIPGYTADDGSFMYRANPKGAGFYTLEVIGPYVVRLAGEPRWAAKGTHAIARLNGTRNFDVIVYRRSENETD